MEHSCRLSNHHLCHPVAQLDLSVLSGQRQCYQHQLDLSGLLGLQVQSALSHQLDL